METIGAQQKRHGSGRPARALRVLRLAGLGLLGLAALFIVLLLLAPVRNRILDAALPQITERLPGSLSIEDAYWHRINALRFEGVSWRAAGAAEPDAAISADSATVLDSVTVLSADTLEVRVKLLPLISRDIKAKYLIAHGITADIPGITGLFASPDSLLPDTGSTDEGGDTGTEGFPRGGSVAGIPSIAIDSLSVTAPRIELGTGSSIEDIVLEAAIDASRGGAPGLTIRNLNLHGGGRDWKVDRLMMAIDFSEGILEGSGEGQFSAGLPFYLEIEPAGPDEFNIVLVEEPGEGPPQEPGIRAAIKLDREARNVISAAYRIEVLTPDTGRLREVPAIADRIKSLPDSRGINLAASGAIAFDPDLDARLRLSVEEPEWLDRAFAVARYREETLDLDSLHVTLIDLELFAEGRLSPDSAVASLTIAAGGSEGLRVIAPEAGIPDSLDLRLRSGIKANLEERHLDGVLTASGEAGGISLDSLDIEAGISLDAAGTSSVKLAARAEGLLISTVAEIERRDGILVRAEPISIRPAEHPGVAAGSPRRPAAGKTGTIAYQQQSGDLRLDGVEIVGALGNLRIDGYRTGDGSGEFDLSCLWMEPPLPLISHVTDSPELVEALRKTWRQDAPYSLEVKAGIRPEGDGNALEIAGDFLLPGPRALRPLFPEGAAVEALGPVGGSIELRSSPVDTLTSVYLMLDLNRTEWVDSSIVTVTGLGRAFSVDSLMLRASGLRLDIAGEYDTEARAGYGTLALSDSGFVRRIFPSAPEADIVAAGRFRAGGLGGGSSGGGSSDDSGETSGEVELALEASVRGDGYMVPALAGSLASDTSGTRAHLICPGGFTYGGLHMDRLEVDYLAVGRDGSLFPADISLDAAGQRFSLIQRARLATGDSLVCAVDAMEISTSKGNLEAGHPFRLIIDRPGEAVILENIELAGGLGRISASGIAGADSVDLEALVDLELPATPPPALGVPEVLWPDGLRAKINATSMHELQAEIAIRGFLLDDGEEGSLDLDARAEAGEISAGLVISDPSGYVLRCAASLPGSLSVYPPSVSLSGGDLLVEAGLDRFPVAVKDFDDGRGRGSDLVARVEGDALLAGPVGGPGAFADMTVRFPGWPEMSDFSIALEAVLEPAEDTVETGDLGEAGEARDRIMSEQERAGDLQAGVARNLGIDGTESLAASLRMLRGAESMLDGNLSLPISLSLAPFELRVDSSRVANVAIKSRQMPLEEVDLLLPVGIGLDGSCSMDFAGRGRADSMSLSGFLKATKLEVEIANLAQIVFDGRADLAGTTKRPAMAGDFTVTSGVITMPESKADLHPVEGEAILLEAETLGLAPPDSARGIAVGSPGFMADYDIRIDIPSGLWLRGEGLEIELRGALQIVQKDGLPLITGDLTAQRGTYLFLGRVFELERGIINFYGTENMNPSLDISLAASIEGNRIWVNLTGDLVEPRLVLESDPEMTDGDIMATVLFGKPLNELNDGQGNMLRDRMTDVLFAMGAARIQQEVAGQYGIDLVSIRSGRGDDEENALVVGKYLTPKLLVSYEQGLKERATSYIVMEYLLGRDVRLETVYGNDGRSSAGINYQRDY
jgi:hypothetical protein